MIRPVTSTRVATNGADEVAGSKPSRRSRIGRSDPISDPHHTTATSESDTVQAMRSQCAPYMLENPDQTVIRRNPTEPKITPSASPEITSRRITRHQSLRLT